MKILWITNILFPEAQQLLSGNGTLKATGGWMLGAAEAFIQLGKGKLSVATVSPLVNKLTRLNGKDMEYYIIPFDAGNFRRNDGYRKYWRAIKDVLDPDIVHIFGTEYSHGLAYVDECGSDSVVVSIQGLTSVYSRYYHQGISAYELLKNITFRDVIKRSGSLLEKYSFKKRGNYEIDLLRKVYHIIGRTSWDKSHAWAINPKAKYHFCNETLRNEFYENTWEYSKCQKHSIFVSQANYPIKGLHMLLQALPLVLRDFPDTMVRVAGHDITYSLSWRERLKMTDYGKYIKKQIVNSNLSSNVTFTGALDAEQMKGEFLRANVFVSPSTIENSPNSVGEAQLLGVPCISSYVGGTMDMINKTSCGDLYRFEEFEMLAFKICEVFKNSAIFDNREMITEAQARHNRIGNANRLLEIYSNILG
jgi:glycosyltransferase involved in cell wall biosynthesis